MVSVTFNYNALFSAFFILSVLIDALIVKLFFWTPNL